MPPGPQLVYDAQSQPTYPGAKPNEIATLIVGGRYYSDWERNEAAEASQLDEAMSTDAQTK